MPRQPAQITHHRTGTRGMGATSRPSSQISVPSPSCPDNRPRSRIIVRARGGWGRRLAHCRRSPSHPPHAPTTSPDHASSYGHEGDGGDVSPIVADLRPIPLMPRQPAQITHHRTGTRGMGATSRPSSQISVPSPSCPDNWSQNRLSLESRYALIAPMAIPSTNSRCATKKRMITGRATVNEAAIKYAQLTSNELRKKLSPSINV